MINRIGGLPPPSGHGPPLQFICEILPDRQRLDPLVRRVDDADLDLDAPQRRRVRRRIRRIDRRRERRAGREERRCGDPVGYDPVAGAWVYSVDHVSQTRRSRTTAGLLSPMLPV